MKYFHRFIASMAFFILSTATFCATQPELNASWINYPTHKLMEMGDKYVRNKEFSDTSLVCYTIVANRYDKDMSAGEKQMCLEANMHLWSIYFYIYYDYTKCFDCLMKAKDIADETGKNFPDIYLGLGCMYQTISEESKNSKLGFKALEYYRKAFASAKKINDGKSMDMAFTNVVSMAYNLHRFSSIAKDWTVYSHLQQKHNSVLMKYNMMLYQAFHCIENKEYDKALDIFDRQLALIIHTEYSRLVYFTYISKTNLLANIGAYEKAIECLKNAESIATEYDMKDCELEVYGLFADFYKQTGDKDLRDAYREKFYTLKDTLTNYRQFASVSEMEFQGKMKSMNEQMADLKYKRHIQNVVISIVACVAVVILVLLLFLYRKNKQLRKSNLSLYRKNVELLRSEESEREMHRKYEPADAVVAAPATDDAANDATDDAAGDGKGDAVNDVKYKNSSLSESDKQELLNRILQVMDDRQEICSAEFSVERLAALTGSKYKYVSQVIHERYGCNFNVFINEYRIKEACKRMNDIENYGNFTIEAISNGVGFKSRSSFVSSFKRFTGLTPSDYQRMANENMK
jgi:AraC-like DNA-binding protein/tetratricopeptide (TPR) repeat protein